MREARERKTAPGVVSHVIARGINRMALFRTAADLYWFCTRLRELKQEMGVDVYAFCLMANHLHLLLRQAEEELGQLMQRLLGAYAIRFNARYGRSGGVFEDRFYSKPCLDDRYFVTLLRYINRNPVEAGLICRPQDWKFSSHRELMGERGLELVNTEFPLALFSGDVDAARAAYAELVGADEFRPAWQAAIVKRFATDGLMLDEVKGRRRGLATDVRHEAIRAALAAGGRAKEICEFLEISAPTVTRARAQIRMPASAMPDYYVPPSLVGQD